MPSFRPALGTTSDVSSPPGSGAQFAQLTFRADFSQGEDSSGVWEIWTDLPALDPTSQPLSSGEWRAIAFAQDDLTAAEQNDQAKGLTISLPATASRAPGVSTNALFARLVIPANRGTSFAYTFRHVDAHGNTQWFGSGESNGVVKIVDGPPAQNLPEVSGSPLGDKNEWSDKHLWSGIAIQFEEARGTKQPICTLLPTATTTKAEVVISTARYDQPFYRNSSSPKFSNTSLATFIATSSRSPLCIPPNVCLPAAPADAIYSVGISRSLFPTCEQHLKDHNTALTLLETTVVDTLVLALGHTPTRRFLAIYRPDASATSIMSIKSALDMDYPLLLSRGADVLFMPDSEALSDARFELSPGTTAEMLSLASFGSLSTRDHRPAQLICAPLAVQPQGEHRKLQEPPAPSILANESSVDPPLASESEVDSEEDDEFAAVPPRTWWWWDAICHFFVGLWYSIRGQQQTDVSDDETSDGDPLVTPPDETTPLLMAPHIQGHASVSTLHIDNLKPLDVCVSKSSSSPSVDFGLHFTFSQAPPFQLYVNAPSAQVDQTLRFSVREGTAGAWSPAPIRVESMSSITAVKVCGEAKGQDETWEVLVETV